MPNTPPGQTNSPPTPPRRRNAICRPCPTACEIAYHSHAHRSVSGGLVEVVDELGADLLVLGSSANGQLGQVVVGSTADRLLHSSPVPLAIAPRGYRGARTGVLTRITCGYPGTPESVDVVRRIADLAKRLEVPLRVITFAVRGRTMYPPEVGLHAEDSILAAWETSAREMLARLRTDGVVGDDVALQVVSGNGWDQALDAAEWERRRGSRAGHLTARRHRPGVPRVARHEDHAAQPRSGSGAARV